MDKPLQNLGKKPIETPSASLVPFERKLQGLSPKARRGDSLCCFEESRKMEWILEPHLFACFADIQAVSQQLLGLVDAHVSIDRAGCITCLLSELMRECRKADMKTLRHHG